MREFGFKGSALRWPASPSARLHSTTPLTSAFSLSSSLLNSTVLQLGSGCDSIHQSDCQIVADTENNQTLTIPPVQSAMISTRGKVNMKFGRIVMRARMPTG